VSEKFYNPSGSPVLLTPDSRFFFGSSGHSRAMAHLVYGLAQQEGFVVITGEVGAGKTMLVEQLWSRLARSSYFIARARPEPVGQMTPGADDRGDLSRWIETLEQHAFRQEQMLKRVLDLLETNVTGQS
jgi:type II secretory pathway predicted ATPase ExeA